MRLSTKIFYTISLGVLLPFLTSAQYLSRLGNFKVDQIKGCAPLTITITPITPCNGGTPCDINYQLTNLTADCNTSFASGQAIVQNNFISPPYAPGKYKLTVLFQSIGCDDIIIEVLPNIQPDFEIYHCTGNEVQVKVTDKNYNYQYKIDYNDGSPIIPVASGNTAKDNHIFASTGLKTIEVRGVIAADAADNCSPKSDTVKIRNVPLPSFSQLEVLTLSSIKLDFINQNHVLYKLEIEPNNNISSFFQPLQDVYNTNTITISSNISPDSKFYCFRLGRNDPCTSTTNYSVNNICSVDFDVDSIAAENQNLLKWTTSSAGVTNYSVSKSLGTPIPQQTASPYVDTGLNCQIYTYQVTSNYSSGIKSISLPKHGTPFSSGPAPAIANITASLNDEGTVASLLWQEGSQPFEYSVFKNGSLLSTTNTEQFTDESYNLNTSDCYSISYRDLCNNTSPTTPSCPVKLESHVQENNSVVLTWSSYSGWASGITVEYKVNKYNSKGELIGTVYRGPDLTWPDNNPDNANQIVNYIIEAYPSDNNISAPAKSNKVNIILHSRVIFPNAFNPESKQPGNDIFKPVKDQYVDKFEMQIFNRWGELIFSTHDLNDGWDGTYKGSPVPNGIYAFVIRVTDTLGRKSNDKGSVLLIRTK
jgi:gliding motility-associated-like protein